MAKKKSKTVVMESAQVADSAVESAVESAPIADSAVESASVAETVPATAIAVAKQNITTIVKEIVDRGDLQELDNLEGYLTKLHGRVRVVLTELKQRQEAAAREPEVLKALYRNTLLIGGEELAATTLQSAATALGYSSEQIENIIESAQSETLAAQQVVSRDGKYFTITINGKNAGSRYRSNMEVSKRLFQAGLISRPYTGTLRDETSLDVTKLAIGDSQSWDTVIVTRTA